MSFSDHIIQLCYFLILVAGPLPLCHLMGLDHRRSVRALILLIGWCVIQTGFILIAGIFQHLNLISILCMEIALFLLGLWLLSVTQRPVRIDKPQWPWMDRILPAMLAFLGMSLTLYCATGVITDGDSLEYHLPVLSQWRQAQGITLLDSRVYDMVAFYPYNWEVLCSAFVLPFNEDFLVLFPNAVSWVLLILAIFHVARELGADKTHAMAGAVLFVCMPLMFEHPNTLRIEMPTTAFFMSGLALILIFRRRRSFLILSLIGGNLGLLAGLKVSGLAYAGILMGILLWDQILHFKTRKKWFALDFRLGKIRLFLGGLLLIFCILLGGFWYVLNAHVCNEYFGNPFSFINPDAGLMGRIKSSTLVHLFEPLNFSHWEILFTQIMENLHLPFFAALLFSIPLVYAGFSPERGLLRKNILCWGALLIITGWIYVITPFSGAPTMNPDAGFSLEFGNQMRFGFPFLAILCVGASLGAAFLNIHKSFMVLLTLATAAIPCVQSGIIDLPFLPVTCVMALLILMILFPIKFRLGAKPFLISLTLLLVICSFFWRNEHADRRLEAYGPAYGFISSKIPPKHPVGHLNSRRSYLFRGIGLDQKLRYAPSASDNREQWINTLRKKKIRYLVVGPVSRKWKKARRMNYLRELAWLNEKKSPFKKIAGDDVYKEPVLYLLKKP